MQHHHRIGIDRSNRGDQFILVVRQAHMIPVRTFGFKDLGQSSEDHGDLHAFRHFHRLGQQDGIGLLAVGVVAPDIGDPLRRFAGADGVRHVDMAGTCALIPGFFGKLADEGNRLIFLEGQRAIVLHQHGAFRRQLPGQGSAGIPVDPGVRLTLLDAILHKFQQAKDGLIQILFIQRTILNGLEDLLPGGVGPTRHFQIQAGGHTFCPILHSAPVRHHEGIGLPLLPENISKQHFVFRAEDAVDGIVGAHETAGFSLFHHRFKGRQVDFPKGALIQVGGAAHPQGFLIVAGKVLGTGRDALALQGLHISRAHFAGHVGIFRKILEIPAAQGAALDVEPRPQQHGHVFRLTFLPQRFTQLPHDLPIKGGGQGGSGGIAHRFDALVDAQMVPLALLLAQSMGAVAHHYARHT